MEASAVQSTESVIDDLTDQNLYRSIRGIPLPFDLLVATPSDLQKHEKNPGLIYGTILAEGKTLYAAR